MVIAGPVRLEVKRELRPKTDIIPLCKRKDV